MSREGPQPSEAESAARRDRKQQTPGEGSSDSAPTAVTMSLREVPGGKAQAGGGMEAEQLSRVRRDGPSVTVSQEIRGLFDKAMGESKDRDEEGEVAAVSAAPRQPTQSESKGGLGAAGAMPRLATAPARISPLNVARSPPSEGPDDHEDTQGDDAALERELEATEAHILKLAMKKEARRLQAAAQQQTDDYQRVLQDELEHKVMQLLAEKDRKTAEAAAVRDDLQGRVRVLQAMIGKLDDKVARYADSYDAMLCELKMEYQMLLSDHRNQIEHTNKGALVEFMATLRKQRQLVVRP